MNQKKKKKNSIVSDDAHCVYWRWWYQVWFDLGYSTRPGIQCRPISLHGDIISLILPAKKKKFKILKNNSFIKISLIIFILYETQCIFSLSLLYTHNDMRRVFFYIELATKIIICSSYFIIIMCALIILTCCCIWLLYMYITVNLVNWKKKGPIVIINAHSRIYLYIIGFLIFLSSTIVSSARNIIGKHLIIGSIIFKYIYIYIIG